MASLDENQPQDKEDQDDDRTDPVPELFPFEEAEDDVDDEIEDDQAIDDLHAFL
jgi:hypothetical protein